MSPSFLEADIVTILAASEKQKKQQQEEDNKNQILINDLDGIQILIKSE